LRRRKEGAELAEQGRRINNRSVCFRQSRREYFYAPSSTLLSVLLANKFRLALEFKFAAGPMPKRPEPFFPLTISIPSFPPPLPRPASAPPFPLFDHVRASQELEGTVRARHRVLQVEIVRGSFDLLRSRELAFLASLPSCSLSSLKLFSVSCEALI